MKVFNRFRSSSNIKLFEKESMGEFLSDSNNQDNAPRVEGEKNLEPDAYESSTIPEPLIESSKFRCPMCDRLFVTKKGYYTHARQKHQVGSSVSTPIY